MKPEFSKEDDTEARRMKQYYPYRRIIGIKSAHGFELFALPTLRASNKRQRELIAEQTEYIVGEWK